MQQRSSSQIPFTSHFLSSEQETKEAITAQVNLKEIKQAKHQRPMLHSIIVYADRKLKNNLCSKSCG